MRHVLQTFYEPLTEEEIIQSVQMQLDVEEIKNVFELVRNNFQEWLRVWRMNVSEGN